MHEVHTHSKWYQFSIKRLLVLTAWAAIGLFAVNNRQSEQVLGLMALACICYIIPWCAGQRYPIASAAVLFPVVTWLCSQLQNHFGTFRPPLSGVWESTVVISAWCSVFALYRHLKFGVKFERPQDFIVCIPYLVWVGICFNPMAARNEEIAKAILYATVTVAMFIWFVWFRVRFGRQPKIRGSSRGTKCFNALFLVLVALIWIVLVALIWISDAKESKEAGIACFLVGLYLFVFGHFLAAFFLAISLTIQFIQNRWTASFDVLGILYFLSVYFCVCYYFG